MWWQSSRSRLIDEIIYCIFFSLPVADVTVLKLAAIGTPEPWEANHHSHPESFYFHTLGPMQTEDNSCRFVGRTFCCSTEPHSPTTLADRQIERRHCRNLWLAIHWFQSLNIDVENYSTIRFNPLVAWTCDRNSCPLTKKTNNHSINLQKMSFWPRKWLNNDKGCRIWLLSLTAAV